jgi:hypothetical protein
MSGTVRLRVGDALDDAEQVEGAAREPVDARHRRHVARSKPVEHPREARADRAALSSPSPCGYPVLDPAARSC